MGVENFPGYKDFGENSGIKFLVEEHENFLHEIKSVAYLLDSNPIDNLCKRALAEKGVLVSGNLGLALSMLENDFSRPEGSVLRNLIVSDGYQATYIRTSFRKDTELFDDGRYKGELIRRYYSDVGEILDRMAIRYERLMEIAQYSLQQENN